MNVINILVSVNKEFFNHIEELIYSILYYSSEQIHFYLMYQENELTQTEITKISQFVENTNKGKLIPIKFDAKFLNGMPITDDEGKFFGLESYSRLFCAFKLPKEVDKILYLDADMICTGDIKELYSISFDGKTWVACQDKGISQKDLDRLGLPKDYKYINSGMLLINVKKLKQDYTKEKIFKLIAENKKVLLYPDQDFINKVFIGDIKIIPNKYNLIAKDVKYKSLKEKPLIIHYAGSVKPWDENVSRFDKEFIDYYYEILRIQKNEKSEKLKNILKKHKIYGYRKEDVDNSIKLL